MQVIHIHHIYNGVTITQHHRAESLGCSEHLHIIQNWRVHYYGDSGPG
jgi:hypothetical protein